MSGADPLIPPPSGEGGSALSPSGVKVAHSATEMPPIPLTRRTPITTGAALVATQIPNHSKTHSKTTDNAIATTGAGTFHGINTAGIHRFLGARYGRAARFQPSIPESHPGKPIAARDIAAVAPQSANRSTAQSKDCLFLNVWTPGIHSAAITPIMLQIRGGACSNGTSTDPLNDGTALAAQDICVVTVNHRLTALGYLYRDRLDAPVVAGSGVDAITETVDGRTSDDQLNDRAVFGISRPQLVAFRPLRPNGVAMLITPGGSSGGPRRQGRL